MTLQEYYKFPEGSNVTQTFIQHWLTDKPNYPCSQNMSYAFAYYKGSYIPPLDVSNTKDVNSMFYYCSNIVSLDLSNWDTSNFQFLNDFCSYCSSLVSIDLSSWNTSKVTNMNNMFYYCKKLAEIKGLDGLDTTNVTTMAGAFGELTSMTSLPALRADSLTIPSYSSPFGSSNNTTLVDWGGFINLKSSWIGSYCLDKLTAISHQSLINILNGLYDFTGNGETPTSGQGQIKFGSAHLAKLSDDEKAIATSKGWTLS